MEEKMKKLEELCKPLVSFIQENYDPYTEIIISDNFIKVTSTEIGIPVKNN